MKLQLLFSTLLLSSTLVAQKTAAEKPTVYTQASPACKKLDSEILQYVVGHMRYPQTAIDNGIEGDCIVTFQIRKDGMLDALMITQKVPDCAECDEAVTKLFQSMPRMKPGKEQKEAVDCSFTIPIHFSVQ